MFAIRNIGVLQYTNGFTFWHYKQGHDSLSAIGQPGFFNGVVDIMAVGDVILVSGTEGAVEYVVRSLVVPVSVAPMKATDPAAEGLAERMAVEGIR